MLKDVLNDRVTLIKADGTVERENIPSLVSAGKIMIQDTTVPLEVGDHLLRKLENGLVEDFVVDDPVFQQGVGGIKSFYNARVSRSGSPTTKYEAAISQITNNFHGANSRVNIGSTDNSTNISTIISSEKIHEFIGQVRPVMSALPEQYIEEIREPFALLEAEAEKPELSQMKVRGALQAIKTVAEGATGNLVASGIVERWSYYFDQLAAILRWIRVSFRLPISLVLFFFHKLHPASIFRGSNAGVRRYSMPSIFRFLCELVNPFQMRSGRCIHISGIAKAAQSCGCRPSSLFHP